MLKQQDNQNLLCRYRSTFEGLDLKTTVFNPELLMPTVLLWAEQVQSAVIRSFQLRNLRGSMHFC